MVIVVERGSCKKERKKEKKDVSGSGCDIKIVWLLIYRKFNWRKKNYNNNNNKLNAIVVVSEG